MEMGIWKWHSIAVLKFELARSHPRTLILLFLLLSLLCRIGYCDPPAIQVKVSLPTPEIFAGQRINATVQVTNIGTFFDLKLPPTNYEAFDDLLSTDNPSLKLSGVGLQTFYVSGRPTPEVTLEPGQSVSKEVTLSGTQKSASPIIFRIGFRITPDSVPVWSKPVRVRIKNDLNLPLKMEASLQEDHIYRSNYLAVINPGMYAMAHIRLINTSRLPQTIGSPETPYKFVIDNPGIHFVSDTIRESIRYPTRPSGEYTTLKPGESIEQDSPLLYLGQDPDPEPMSFRIGYKRTGSDSVWSDPLTVHVVDLNHATKPPAVLPPDGIVKTYYESGSPKEEYTYKRGKLNGPYKSYLANGQRWQELNYADNLLEGREKQYDGKGKLIAEQTYSQNQLVSGVYFKKDGTIDSHLTYMAMGIDKYVPLGRACAEDDSAPEVLKTVPRCNSSDNK